MSLAAGGIAMSSATTYITYNQYRLLEDAAKNLKEQLILALLFRSGLRVHEVVSLRVKDAIFSAEDYRLSYLNVLGKGGKGKREYALMDPQTQNLIREQIEKLKLDTDDYILNGYSRKCRVCTSINVYLYKNHPNAELLTGKHLSIPYVQKVIPKIALRDGIVDAGGKKLHPHTLRHSFAIHLTRSKIPIEKVAKYLRHKSLASALPYLRYTITDYQESYFSVMDHDPGTLVDPSDAEAVSSLFEPQQGMSEDK